MSKSFQNPSARKCHKRKRMGVAEEISREGERERRRVCLTIEGHVCISLQRNNETMKNIVNVQVLRDVVIETTSNRIGKQVSILVS